MERVIRFGVQTWGTDVAALARYWTAAERLGYARVTYGDGLWSPWTSCERSGGERR